MRRLCTVSTHFARVTRLGSPDVGNCPDRKWPPTPGGQTTTTTTTKEKPPFPRSSLSSRPWVLCQDAEVYQQCLLCDASAEMQAQHANQDPPRPAMHSKCQTPPKTHSPALAHQHHLHSLSSSAHRAGSSDCVVANRTTCAESPGQPFRGLRCARPPFF